MKNDLQRESDWIHWINSDSAIRVMNQRQPGMTHVSSRKTALFST
jgi:hypothetical protein